MARDQLSIKEISENDKIATSLVTQPMLQLTPNCSELRSMDLYNQILCRFQKCKRKVPPPSLPPFEKKTSFFMEVKIYLHKIWL